MKSDTLLDVDPGAVIIVQGDHGPEFACPEGLSYPASRLGLFSAMRLSPGCEVSDDLSLVNTFRVVFDCLAFEDVELLPRRAWIEVTGEYELRSADPPTQLGILARALPSR